MWQEETGLCQAMTIHLQIDVKVGAYTKFQNPTTTPSGRLSKEPRGEEEREKITPLITATTLNLLAKIDKDTISIDNGYTNLNLIQMPKT